MDSSPADARKGMLLAILAFSLWASGDAIVKYIGSTTSIYTIVFYDMVTIMVFLTAVGLSQKFGTLRDAVFSPHWKWHALRGVVLYFQFLAGMYAFTHMSLARAYTLLFTMPMVTAPLALLFMKERIDRNKGVAIAFGFIGVLVVLRPGLIPLDLPSMIALLSAVLFSVSNLITRHIGLKGQQSQLSFAYMPEFICFLCTIPFYGYMTHFALPGLNIFLWIVVIGVVSGIGFLALSSAFATTPAAAVAPFHYSQILWAVLFGYTVFGDMPDIWVAAGAAIIVASGLWLIRQEGRIAADPLPDALAVAPPAGRA
ncbi:MAG TPA: DMT family transporter [Patescibacteria group bacterium]|jgi:drug/metabolite transporter (DMT)-like permease|nr:DMT family transporter [Patescibacteria group bacterium]